MKVTTKRQTCDRKAIAAVIDNWVYFYAANGNIVSLDPHGQVSICHWKTLEEGKEKYHGGCKLIYKGDKIELEF